MDLGRRHSTRGTSDFKWNIGLEFVRGRPGEHSVSQRFTRCNHTWQLRLESQERDLPPLLSIELVSHIKSSFQAVVSCRFWPRFCRNVSDDIRTITKVCKFCKKRKHIVQRCELGPLSSNSNLILCTISSVQHLNPAENVKIKESNIPALSVAPVSQSSESSSEKEQGHLPHQQSASHISDSSTEGSETSNTEFTLPLPPLDTLIMDSQTSKPLTCDAVIKISRSMGVISSSPNHDEQQQVIGQVTSPLMPSQQPLLISPSVNLEVSVEVIRTLLHDNDFSDITLITPSGRHFKAHRAILSVRSSKFYYMLKENQGGQRNEIQLHDISDESLEKILEYIYLGKVSSLGDNVIELCRASEIFELHYLKNECLQTVKEKLDPGNASDILIFSDKANLIDLKEHVLEFINQNIKGILDLDSFQRLKKEHPALVADLYVALGKSI